MRRIPKKLATYGHPRAKRTPFAHWQSLPDGGRRYWLDVSGRQGWRARYLKEVDGAELTLRFWQEIYDEHGRLVETREKCPVGRGHRKA